MIQTDATGTDGRCQSTPAAARGRKGGDGRGLGVDLVKVGSQHAPREIGDLRGFLDWSLEQVEWQAVNHFIADRNAASVAAPVDTPATSAVPDYTE